MAALRILGTYMIWLPLGVLESMFRFAGEVIGAVRQDYFKRWDHHTWLKHDLADCDSVLELGCGASSPLLRIGYGKKTSSIDVYPPYVEMHNRQGDYKSCDLCNVFDHPFKPKSFDAVVICDVMEHLPRSRVVAEKLFEKMEQTARKKVIIFTPNGFTPNDQPDGNVHQEHVSSWEPSDYTEHGYTVRGAHGWRWIFGKAGLPIRRPYFLWHIIGMLSIPAVYGKPEWAAHSYAVKQVSGGKTE